MLIRCLPVVVVAPTPFFLRTTPCSSGQLACERTLPAHVTKRPNRTPGALIRPQEIQSQIEKGTLNEWDAQAATCLFV